MVQDKRMRLRNEYGKRERMRNEYGRKEEYE